MFIESRVHLKDLAFEGAEDLLSLGPWIHSALSNGEETLRFVAVYETSHSAGRTLCRRFASVLLRLSDDAMNKAVSSVRLIIELKQTNMGRK
jgi:hypothetical protein